MRLDMEAACVMRHDKPLKSGRALYDIRSIGHLAWETGIISITKVYVSLWELQLAAERSEPSPSAAERL